MQLYCIIFFGFPVGTTVIIMNIPLFMFAFYKSGKNFLLKTIFGTICLSVFIDLLAFIKPFTDDKFLAAIYGGILTGIGESLIFKVQNATGGSDLIVQIIQNYSKKISRSNLLARNRWCNCIS